MTTPHPPAQLDRNRIELIETLLLGSPVARSIGIELERAAPGNAILALPFRPENVTVGRVIHGGVIATLADVCGVCAAVTAAESLPLAGATANLSITFLAPADGSALRANGTVLRAGRSQSVCRVEITDDGDRRVAEALVTVMLRATDPQTTGAAPGTGRPET